MGLILWTLAVYFGIALVIYLGMTLQDVYVYLRRGHLDNKFPINSLPTHGIILVGAMLWGPMLWLTWREFKK